MAKQLTCAIIDDEPLAVKLLESYAQKTSFLNLVATYGSAVEAMYALQTSPVDILFLDIQMPDLTGLDFARMIPSSIHVVFTTAFREFAIDGYKVGAVDYLLKPIAYTDFLSAAQRVLTVVGRQAAEEVVCKPKTVTENLPAEDGNIDAALPVEDGMFFVKSDYKYVRVSCQDILYIEGLKDYVKMHLASSQRAVVSLVSMRTLENTLPSTSFLRIHRSYIVNMKRVSMVDRNSVAIADFVLPISDSYKDAVQKYVSEHAIQGR